MHNDYLFFRRTDPTAGHIMHNMKGLLPSTLPPLSTTISTVPDSLTYVSKHKKLPNLGGGGPRVMHSLSSNSMLSSIASGDNDGSPFIDLMPSPEGKPSSSSNKKQSVSRRSVSENSNRKTIRRGSSGADNDGTSSSRGSSRGENGRKSLGGTMDDMQTLEETLEESDADSQFTHESNTDDQMLIASRPMAIPFDSKNCLVQVYAPRTYDESIRIRIISSGINPQKLFERDLTIDKAYEIVNTLGQSSQIMHTSDNEDLQSLSTMLINMFKEADDDGSGKKRIFVLPLFFFLNSCCFIGSLTFDEFQKLMEQVELGISPQELRFVISEADENENGVVDYEEFVPLAVDLIQSFRARNRAKTMNSQEDVLVDDQILQTISGTELKDTAEKCLAKIFEFDSKKYGLIRVPDLKRCLQAIANNVGLADNEISMLCQLLPRDQFGRIKYNTTPTTLFDCLSKVRFMTMKNAIVESKGSGLQKYLLDLCKEEEKKLANYNGNSKEKFVPTGIVPCRSLINILSNSPRLSLSRLQVLVIMSEASVLDGMINYFQFIPVVAKAIEIMFEPKALRQRAELIEKTDLSPEALLQGMSSEMFEQRLLTLFKSYDIDHNGTLDQNEFIACLESLDLQLSYGEMVALMAAADVEQAGFLKFEDFVGFFTHNLLNLEREKHIRLLQTSLHKNKHGQTSGKSKISTDPSNDLTQRLLALFRLSDPGQSGYIPFDDFEAILQNLSINTSKFLIDVLVSELHVNENGLVEYEKSLKTCTELFRIYQAKETVMEEHKIKEKNAEDKAIKITEACADEIHQIVRYLTKKFKAINEHASLSPIAKYLDIQEAIRSPNSGLSRNESNMILTKLFIGMDDKRIHSMRSVSQDVGSDGSPGLSLSPTHQASSTSLNTNKAAEKDNNTVSTANNASIVTFAPIAPITIPLEYTPIRNNVHTPKFRNSIKSLRFQFSSQELYNAIFEAKKITIMRSLLQEIDIDATQQAILSMLQEDLLQRQKNNEISPDSTYLPVSVCYSVLENIHELRLNRAQIMFLISLADCYDREGKTLEIYRFAEHASAIIAHIHDSEVLETRAEVMQMTVIDDRKAFQGLREKEFIEELTCRIMDIIEQRNHLLKELSFNHKVFQAHHSSNNLSSQKAGALTKIAIKESKDEYDDLPQGEEERLEEDLERLENELDQKYLLLSKLDDDTICREELFELLRTLPRQKFTDREVHTILAGLRVPIYRGKKADDSEEGPAEGNDDELFDNLRSSFSTSEVNNMDVINWHELLPPLVEALRAYAREHLIHRRVSLVATSNSMTPSAADHATPKSSSMSLASESSTKTLKFQEESIKALKQLAEKLLNYVKIVGSNDGTVSLQLPIDSQNPPNLRRTSSQILSKDDVKLDDHHTEITQLHRCAAFVKFSTIRTVTLQPIKENEKLKHDRRGYTHKEFSSNTLGRSIATSEGIPSSGSASGHNLLSQLQSAISSANLNAGTMTRAQSMMLNTSANAGNNTSRSVSSPNRLHASTSNIGDLLHSPGNPSAMNSYTEVVNEEMIPLFIEILAVEDTRYYNSCNLIGNFISPSGSFTICESLPMKLPTIGIVDKEAAEQFASNLIDKLYFEMDEKEKKPILKMNDIV
jgi:Ca2+-binding EF-hand superfamily protein